MPLNAPFLRPRPAQVFEAVARAGRRPPVPPSMPRALVLLMQHCWAEEPGDRPAFATVHGILIKLLAAEAADA